MTTTNHKPVERIYPDDKRVKPQTIAHHKARYEFASKIRKPQGFALDLGCGTGYGTDMLAKAGYAARGWDVSEEALEYARANYPTTSFYLRDLTANPPMDANNLITFFEVIEHLKYSQGVELLESINESLYPGGMLILSTPHDFNGKYNNFHKSEWNFDLLKNIVGSIFDKVTMYGQDWDTAEISDKDVRDNDFYIVVAEKLENKL